MSGVETESITVTLLGLPPRSELGEQWTQLETQAEHSFFTSWSWIDCWLGSLEPPGRLHLLRATRAGHVVGLALWISRRGKSLRALPLRCLHLHATGDPKQDEITIEHNGFLVHRNGGAQIEAAMYAHLLTRARHWDQLLLPGLTTSPSLNSLLPRNMVLREQVHLSYAVDLREVRRRDGNYLGMLSSNSRQQVRRSMKAYEALGPMRLTEAKDLGTALNYLESLRLLHEKRWSGKGHVGAFANPSFAAFHLRLIGAAFPRGDIQLLRVQAGARDVGYLYNFVHRGRVLFYQSGFDYELLQHNSRPGLVTHTLAVHHNAGLGNDIYDFLAGSARYKRSLASTEGSMVWATVHRRTLAFRIEEVLRHAKRRWESAIAARSSDAAAATVTQFNRPGDTPPIAIQQGTTGHHEH